MIKGSVRSLHIILPVRFLLPTQEISVEFIVDTGFTGLLTLPQNDVSALNLTSLHKTDAQLADGSSVEVKVYAATIFWKGVETAVRVIATGERPLLGTALLDQSELLARFVEAGLVTVQDV